MAAFGAASEENKDGSNPSIQGIAAIFFLLRLFSSEGCYRNFQEEKKKNKNNVFFLGNCFERSVFVVRFEDKKAPLCRLAKGRRNTNGLGRATGLLLLGLSGQKLFPARFQLTQIAFVAGDANVAFQ